MKKLLSLAAVGLALCGLFVSCASTGKASAPTSVHPREYVLDVIDGGENLALVWNQYGPNYQVTPFFTGLLKKDKPQAGDTVTFKIKAVSDIDLPELLAYPCSTSPNWTNLAGESFVLAENIKAGEAFEAELTVVLTEGMGGDFALCMQYDNPEQEVKAGGPAKLALERVCESTDTTKEVPSAPHKTEVTVDLNKYSALTEVATNHPWINGAQDMSVISNYEVGPDVTAAYGDDLPKAGDIMHFHYKGTSDNDISKVYIRLVDRSPAANWWKELSVPPAEGEKWESDNYIFAENIKAGEPFEVNLDLVFGADAIGQVNVDIWYEVGAATGPSTWIIVRD